MNYLALALAGCLGTLARYTLTQWLAPQSPSFPLPTFVVNVVGCLLFGLCWGFGAQRWPHATMTAILVGFFGAFTTFSSFAFDSVAMIERQQYVGAAINVVGQNVLGLLAMLAGMAAGRAL